MRFTLWDSKYAKVGKVHEASWEEISRDLQEHQATDRKKSTLPCLVLGQMVEDDRRNNKNVLTIEALALDIERDADDVVEVFNERLEHALRRLQDIEYHAWTTFSHTSLEQRIRVIVPLASALTPDQYKPAMSYLNGLTGSIADPNAQKLSQPVFIPMHASTSAEEHWSVRHPGDMLDLGSAHVMEVMELRSSLGDGMGRAPHEANIRQACKKVLAGKAFADDGNRDETVLRIAWHLSKRHRGASLAALDEVFYWSLRAMGSEAPTAENIQSKIERGYEKRDDEVSGGIAVEGPAIIQHKASYYFRLPDGGFSRAYTKDECRMASGKHLRELDGVQLDYITQSGASRRKSTEDLCDQYGDLAEDVAVDLTLGTSVFEDTILREATVRWPVLESLFDPDIDRWITLLGGEKLKDWLSLLADLNRLSSALVIMGPKNIGKTLLALGCAKRFGASAPAKQRALTGKFQEELARCPLVYVDEDIEENPYDRNFLSTIRSELSIKERSVDRKYISHAQVTGAIRCIISANHLPFKQKDAQTDKDLQAIAERFYWINSKDGVAAKFLDSIAEREDGTLDYWRSEGFPRYLKHLEETRSVSKRYRFGVSGDSEELADLINIGVDWNSWVTEWVCNGVFDHFQKLRAGDRDVKNGGIIFNGAVYVRVRTVVKAWDRYLPQVYKAADTRPISEALQGISVSDERYRPKDIGVPGNNQTRYFKIRKSPMLLYLKEYNLGEPEELEEALLKSTVHPEAAPTTPTATPWRG